MKRLVPACIALAAIAVVALPATPAGAGTGFTLKEKQWSISKPPTLKHGVTYTVTVKNVGTFPHDLLIDGKGVSDRGIHNAHPVAPGQGRELHGQVPAGRDLPVLLRDQGPRCQRHANERQSLVGPQPDAVAAAVTSTSRRGDRRSGCGASGEAAQVDRARSRDDRTVGADA